MDREVDGRMRVGWPGGLGLALVWCAFAAVAVGAEEARVGPERCGECHKLEFRAWDRSHHALLLSDSESEEVLEKSEEIPSLLGIDDIETDAACSGCHFSYHEDEEGEKQLGSVDCESCHGAAAAWIDLHSDYGSKDGKQIERALDEDPAHRQARLADAKAKGMLHPGEIVLVTSNCLGCHTGPGEREVNVGGHTPGSDFELVSWLSGEVRHNFHRTDQGENAKITAARARQLYVVGRSLELEYALRGLAKATASGPFLQAMVERTEKARGHLEEIVKVAPAPQLSEILEAAGGVAREANQKVQAAAAADRIQEAARSYAASHDGSALGAVDALLPKEARGSVYAGD